MRHMEAYCDAAIANLRALLPSKIAAQNAAHTDYAVPDVPDDGTGDGHDGSEFHFGGNTTPVRWPYIDVASPDGRLTLPSLENVVLRARSRVMVRAWLQSHDFEELTRTSYRMAEAIAACQLLPAAFGEGVYVAELAIFVRVNPETEQMEQFTAGVLLVFTVERNVSVG